MQNWKLRLNKSDTGNGIVHAAVATALPKRYKIRLRQIGQAGYDTYDLRNDGLFEAFPLRDGDGMYRVELYENVSGKTYTKVASLDFPVKLSRIDAAQLQPNQYVNYTTNSPVVGIANVLCNGIAEEAEKYNRICNYVIEHYRYDYVKAVLTKPGTLPDIDGTYRKGMGICQDLSAITVAMLRSQGIPAKLVVGYAGKQYHAWVTAKVGNKEHFFDPTAAVSNKRLSKNYTIERWY